MRSGDEFGNHLVADRMVVNHDALCAFVKGGVSAMKTTNWLSQFMGIGEGREMQSSSKSEKRHTISYAITTIA